MDFLYLLEKIRIPGLNELMLAITTLGAETAFLVIAMILFWCIDKQRGYYTLSVGLFGTLISQFMKIVCRIPRPWVLDENFTILEQAREAASGYSFPSGHTQSAVGTFGAIAATEKKKWLRWTCVVIAVLVGFSRMYVGVHTPADVSVGALISIVLIIALYPLMVKSDRYTPYVLTGLTLVSLVYLLFLEFYPFPADIDPHNMASAMKNGYTMLGAGSGLLIAYLADCKRNFPVKACWWVQILKVVIGLALVLLVKEGLRSPLDALFQGHLAARAVRYFLIVIVAGVVWPQSFFAFSKFGNAKQSERSS